VSLLIHFSIAAPPPPLCYIPLHLQLLYPLPHHQSHILVQRGTCTFSACDALFYQNWFHCRTCTGNVSPRKRNALSDYQGVVMCELCAFTCHQGHSIVQGRNSPASIICKCGAGQIVGSATCLHTDCTSFNMGHDSSESSGSGRSGNSTTSRLAWECDFCTFENRGAAIRCVLCGHNVMADVAVTGNGSMTEEVKSSSRAFDHDTQQAQLQLQLQIQPKHELAGSGHPIIPDPGSTWTCASCGCITCDSQCPTCGYVPLLHIHEMYLRS
jgi:hypothetical protein